MKFETIEIQKYFETFHDCRGEKKCTSSKERNNGQSNADTADQVLPTSNFNHCLQKKSLPVTCTFVNMNEYKTSIYMNEYKTT